MSLDQNVEEMFLTYDKYLQGCESHLEQLVCHCEVGFRQGDRRDMDEQLLFANSHTTESSQSVIRHLNLIQACSWLVAMMVS